MQWYDRADAYNSKELDFMFFILYLYASTLPSKVKAIRIEGKQNLCWVSLYT